MELKKIKIASILLLFTLIGSAKAQEKSAKVREVGIGFSNFNSYSLQYRWGNEKRLFRLNAAIGSQNGQQKDKNKNVTSFMGQTKTSISEVTTKSPFKIDINWGFSVLKLHAINEKFGFVHGAVLGIAYQYNKQKTTSTLNEQTGNGQSTTTNLSGSIQTNNSISPYMGIVLGAYYKLNNEFSIYAEIDPNVNFNYSKSKYETSSPETSQSSSKNITSTNQNHNFGISGLTNSGAALTLVYRF